MRVKKERDKKTVIHATHLGGIQCSGQEVNVCALKNIKWFD